MKKIADLNWKETKRFVITLKSQLALITSDKDLKAVVEAIQGIKSGKETDKTYLDAMYAVIDSLLVTNEGALDTIVAACMDITVEELQEANNIDVIETVVDFFSIEKYRELFIRAIKSGSKGQ